MRRLSVDLLEELAERWHAQGVPVLNYLQPGLTDGDIDAITASVGIRLPEEPRVWWGWRNGVPASVYADRMGIARFITQGFEYLPLEEAVARYQDERKTAEEAAGVSNLNPPEFHDRPADWWWEPTWLPLLATGSAGVVACDCSLPHGDGTPILYVDWGAFGEASRRTRAPSFGEMVSWWIEAFDDGAMRYHAAERRWEHHWEWLSPERGFSRLV